jgi:hypothetical protein
MNNEGGHFDERAYFPIVEFVQVLGWEPGSPLPADTGRGSDISGLFAGRAADAAAIFGLSASEEAAGGTELVGSDQACCDRGPAVSEDARRPCTVPQAEFSPVVAI